MKTKARGPESAHKKILVILFHSSQLKSSLPFKAHTKKALTKASVGRSAHTNVFSIAKFLPGERLYHVIYHLGAVGSE